MEFTTQLEMQSQIGNIQVDKMIKEFPLIGWKIKYLA